MAYPTTSPNWDPFLSAMSSVDSAVSAVGTVQAGDPVVLENYTDLRTAIVELSDALDALRDGSFYAPVGLIAPFGGAVGEVPTGWLLCNGAAVSQTTYASLYAVVGANAFGSDGGGNFYLPDLQGRVIAGVDGTGVTDANAHPTRLRPLSATAANRGGVIGDLRLQAHTHSITDPGHSHSYEIGGTSLGVVNSNDRPARAVPGVSNPTHPGINGSTTGITGTNAHNQNQGGAQNVQPTMMLNYIIKW